MKKTDIGGQGVLEGVMMRGPEVCGLAVRKASGSGCSRSASAVLGGVELAGRFLFSICGLMGERRV